MKMDSSIFTRMLKYIQQDVEQENAYLLDILGTALYKDRAFCESVLYLADIDEVVCPEFESDPNGICIRQQDDWMVIFSTKLSSQESLYQQLNNSNCSLNVLVNLGHEDRQLEASMGSFQEIDISFRKLAMIIDETCSDMTIELHQFLVENYLVNQLEPG